VKINSDLLLACGQLIPEVGNQILELLSTSLQWPLVLERAYSRFRAFPRRFRPRSKERTWPRRGVTDS